MKTEKAIITLAFILIAVHLSYSQPINGKEIIKKDRIRKIDFYHSTIGIELSANKGLYGSPKLSFGVGSYRNLFNIDIGLKYKFGNPFYFDDKEHLAPQQLNSFILTQLNIISWQTNCFFIGGECDFCLPVTTIHHLPSSQIIEYDQEIGIKHFTAQINTGIKLDKWNLFFFYEYDLSPALDQKKVYESTLFNYDDLHDILFERNRLGVSIAYQIPFKI